MSSSYEHASFNVFDDLESRKKGKKEDTRFYSILGVRPKRPSSKKRRGLILRSLRQNVLKVRKPRKMMSQMGKVHVRSKKDKTKQDPAYFFGLHSYLRRKL